jgi:hypothetical protein
MAFLRALLDDPTQLVVAVSAVLAAGFTWRAAVHAARSAEASERWAFLSQSPIVVPWVSGAVKVMVMNRGRTDAHHLEWSIWADGNRVAGGSSDQVLADSRSRPLDTIPPSVNLHRQVVEVECAYSSSWGDDYVLTRTYRPGKPSRIELRGPDGEVVSRGMKKWKRPRRSLAQRYWRRRRSAIR